MAILGDTICCGSARFSIRDVTVEPVLFLYMFAANVVFPALQALTYHKVCIQRFNASFCQRLRNVTFQQEHSADNDFVQSATSHWILLGNVATTLPACFTVFFFLGSFGDKVGRKFPVLLPLLGAIAEAAASLLNALFPAAPLCLLLVGPLLNGLCGGIIACFMAVLSYVSHIAQPQSKTMRIGIVESMIFMAGTLGVFISGAVLDRTSFAFVFGFSAGLQCLALVYVLLWLPDIKPAQPGAAVVRWGRWACDSLTDMGRFLKRPRGPRVRLNILLLIVTIDVVLLCTIGELDILLLYLRLEPLAWSQTLFGYFKGVENLLQGLMLILVLPFLKRKLRVCDTFLVMGGILSKVVGLAVMGLANTTWLVFAAGVVSMAQGLPSVGLQSMMSSLVEQEEQGRLFSLVAASESLVAVLAALLFNTIYPETLHFFPGFSFIMAAAISFVAFFIVVYLHRTGTGQLGAIPPYRTMAEDTEKPDTEKPDTGKPDTEKPDTEKPDTERPDTEEPDTDGGGREGATFHIATLASEDVVVYI